MTITAAVTLEELRDLFAGVPHETGWATTPSYSVRLGEEIAKRCDCQHDWQLRQVLYDTTPEDEIPADAIATIKLACERYRNWRTLQRTGRGL